MLSEAISNHRFALMMIMGCCTAILILFFDLYFPLGVAAATPYVILVLIGLWYRSKSVVLIMAGIGTLLTLLGYFFSMPGAEAGVALLNRALALFGIWVTAAVAYIHLRTIGTLQPLADTDQATGLFNRHYFMAEAVKQINLWQRHHEPFSMIMLDVDNFKNINDTYGHPAGDYALQSIGDICKHLVREIDTVARIGGEEFAILMPSTDIYGALQTAERIRTHVEKCKFQYENLHFELTISLGIVELQDEKWDIHTLMKHADKALYKAKAAGRNRTYISTRRKPIADQGKQLAY